MTVSILKHVSDWYPIRSDAVRADVISVGNAPIRGDFCRFHWRTVKLIRLWHVSESIKSHSITEMFLFVHCLREEALFGSSSFKRFEQGLPARYYLLLILFRHGPIDYLSEYSLQIWIRSYQYIYIMLSLDSLDFTNVKAGHSRIGEFHILGYILTTSLPLLHQHLLTDCIFKVDCLVKNAQSTDNLRSVWPYWRSRDIDECKRKETGKFMYPHE
jgi:hypothetical protein